MIFQSSLRKELTRNFGATLVILVTIVMTMTLTRIVGQASRGVFRPSDIFIIMGYTVLSELPTVLALCLFIAVIATLTRMYADSEMVIWHSSGQGLLSIVKPVILFAWPLIAIIFILSLILLPFANSTINTLQSSYASRGDIHRLEPGQFSTSEDGRAMFYVDTNRKQERQGNNVFIQVNKNDKKILLTARQGKLLKINNRPYVQLTDGKEIQHNIEDNTYSTIKFDTYTVLIPGIKTDNLPNTTDTGSHSTIELLTEHTASNAAELSWRLGQGLIAFNFIFIAIAATRFNHRVGKAVNLGIALLVFAIYFNLMLVGRNWMERGEISFLTYLIGLHGGTFIFSMLWLLKRHFNFQFFNLDRWKRV